MFFFDCDRNHILCYGFFFFFKQNTADDIRISDWSSYVFSSDLEDPDGRWRRWCNDALARDYPPLWQRIDRLLFLQGPGFDIVPRWRWQQEQSLQAKHQDRQAMTREQVERFVQFFERTSRQAMRTLPGIADRTVGLDAQRHPL